MTQTSHGIVKQVGKDRYVFRLAERHYNPGGGEIQISQGQIQKFGLVEGSGLTGIVDSRGRQSRLVNIESIGGLSPEDYSRRPRFKDLVAVDPTERFNLGAGGDPSMRIVDLMAPIGKGSRQLIVSPPRAGKTMLLEQMVRSIQADAPECRVIVLLIDERPEEVTSFRRSIEGADVVASTNDHTADEHVGLVNMMLAHVQSELECGQDVALLIDSLTRVGRAFNNRTQDRRGRRGTIMSGGLESGVMEVPRRLFGLARNIENGGSVTIVATCLIDTGSRMDQVIFEEFKGTGNSEIVLDRELADARIFPAIDIPASGTRKEALLYGEKKTQGLNKLRRMMAEFDHREAVEALLNQLTKFESNEELLESLLPRE